MTNNHVLGSDAEATASEVEFGYQYEPGGRLTQGQCFRFAPEEFVRDRPGAGLHPGRRPPRGLDEFGHVSLNDDDGAVLVGEYMNIVQHPNGLPKQLAFRDNQVTDLLDRPLYPLPAPTPSPGSSGSPVFNDQWEMVALHHSGVPKGTSQNLRILAARRDSSGHRRQGRATPSTGSPDEGVRHGRVLGLVRDARLGPVPGPAA